MYEEVTILKLAQALRNRLTENVETMDKLDEHTLRVLRDLKLILAGHIPDGDI